MAKKILFIGGSLNQTTMMQKIAQNLLQYDCYFTPFYADGIIDLAARAGLLKYSILGEAHQKSTRKYLKEHHLKVDDRGQQHDYDLILTCSDLIVQNNIKGKKVILVQEGITEPENIGYYLVKYLKFPRWFANTAAMGYSNQYDVFCVASPGYRNHFIREGINPDKLFVTGIPNFDNLAKHCRNDFSKEGYVLAATSPLRESLRPDRRIEWIKEARAIAASRQLIFKLHPAENHRRAIREIRRHAPGALIYVSGDTNEMIANCETLVTQTSTVTFVGVALGKEVYTQLDLQKVRELMPVQNDGASAWKIAKICRLVINTPLNVLRSRKGYARLRSRWAKFDII